MGLDIRTGKLSAAPDAVQPSAPQPGVAGVTPTTFVASGPADAGPLRTEPRDCTGERLEQLAAGEADWAAAQSAGMAAEDDRRSHYEQDILPIGSAYGDTMTLAGGSLDPGAGGGETLPAGYFYDPPREGAPETHLANTGNEPN